MLNSIKKYPKSFLLYTKSLLIRFSDVSSKLLWLSLIFITSIFNKIKFDSSFLFYIRGVSFSKVKNNKKAIESFEQGLKLSSDSRLILGLAKSKVKAGKFHDSIVLCELLLKDGVSSKSLHALYWKALVGEEKYSEAAIYAKKHVEKHGEEVFSAHYFLIIARKFNRLKLWSECLTYCDFAASLKGIPDEILHLKGISYAQIGDLKKSEETYITLMERNYSYPPGHFGLVRSYFRQERYKDVIESCRYIFSHFSPPTDIYLIMTESLIGEKLYLEAEQFVSNYFKSRGLTYNHRLILRGMVEINDLERSLLRCLWKIKIKLKKFEAAKELYIDLHRLSQRDSLLRFYGEESLFVPCFDNSITGVYT